MQHVFGLLIGPQITGSTFAGTMRKKTGQRFVAGFKNKKQSNKFNHLKINSQINPIHHII
ncbi:hypothetical protein [Silvimonas amylolytica]|uniref:hypothetical protein n=1 Tax=Silvimonas amylolytica TaxID=449663 RepID=UPI00166BC59B|nr:hypothetical protein [Silvimonas amylolytica]